MKADQSNPMVSFHTNRIVAEELEADLRSRVDSIFCENWDKSAPNSMWNVVSLRVNFELYDGMFWPLYWPVYSFERRNLSSHPSLDKFLKECEA